MIVRYLVSDKTGDTLAFEVEQPFPPRVGEEINLYVGDECREEAVVTDVIWTMHDQDALDKTLKQYKKAGNECPYTGKVDVSVWADYSAHPRG